MLSCITFDQRGNAGPKRNMFAICYFEFKSDFRLYLRIGTYLCRYVPEFPEVAAVFPGTLFDSEKI
jgi:hypothetical protein